MFARCKIQSSSLFCGSQSLSKDSESLSSSSLHPSSKLFVKRKSHRGEINAESFLSPYFYRLSCKVSPFVTFLPLKLNSYESSAFSISLHKLSTLTCYVFFRVGCFIPTEAGMDNFRVSVFKPRENFLSFFLGAWELV